MSRCSLWSRFAGSTPSRRSTRRFEAGADLVGFVRYPRSPRHLTLDEGRALSARAKGKAVRVALTVDADDEELANILEALDPDLLQLHGEETPERVAEIRAASAGR